MTSGTALSMSHTYSGFLPWGIFTFAYRKSGCAAIARLAGRGHGGGGQLIRGSSGLAARGEFILNDGHLSLGYRSLASRRGALPRGHPSVGRGVSSHPSCLWA